MKNIWVPISGQIAQQRKVETIANNIANANTAGFKKDTVTFKEYLTALDKGADNIDLPKKEWNPDDFYRTQGAENSYVKVDGTYTNFEQGSLQPTNNAMDFALFGKGFFEVLTPNGIRYSRHGSFHLSAEGHMVNDKGHKLLSPPGGVDQDVKDRLIALPVGESFSVSKDGKIYSNNGLVNSMSIVEFKDPHSLQKEGGQLFINNSNDNILREKISTSVNQGFIEGSNVNAVHEMSELIQAHRHFDNIQKAISTYDSISGKAVNDIAKF